MNDLRYIASVSKKPLVIPGIAINPGTSVETVMEMLRIVKKVLVMSVNPGNAGQIYLPYVGKKLTKLLALKEDICTRRWRCIVGSAYME